MLTRRFAVHLNRSLVGLLGIVIKKTVVAYLRSFPCVVVKKAFEVTCGDQIFLRGEPCGIGRSLPRPRSGR